MWVGRTGLNQSTRDFSFMMYKQHTCTAQIQQQHCTPHFQNRVWNRCAKVNWSHSCRQTQEMLMPNQDIINYFLQKVSSFLSTLYNSQLRRKGTFDSRSYWRRLTDSTLEGCQTEMFLQNSIPRCQAWAVGFFTSEQRLAPAKSILNELHQMCSYFFDQIRSQCSNSTRVCTQRAECSCPGTNQHASCLPGHTLKLAWECCECVNVSCTSCRVNLTIPNQSECC